MRPQIGVSGFRIDLGVVHPDRPGDHLVGEGCDGAMHHSALTECARDQVRQAGLEGLGWRVVRIWSTDDRVDAPAVIERLQADRRIGPPAVWGERAGWRTNPAFAPI